MAGDVAPPDAGDAGTADHPVRSRQAGNGADPFEQVGAEVAAVLRSAEEAAADRAVAAETEANRIRDEADGYAHRLRTESEAEAERVRSEAELQARNARTALDEATEQARITIRQANDEAVALKAEAEESAGRRRQELLVAAEQQAGRAATIERAVHSRLVSVREDLDEAVGRLDPDASAATVESAHEQASALDPADSPPADPGRTLGQGPPTPPVPPPPASADEDESDTEVADAEGGLPYAAADEPLDEPTAGAADDEIPPMPPPPPPPPGYLSEHVGGAPDLPYADDDETNEDETVIDLRGGDPAEAAGDANGTDEPANGTAEDANGTAEHANGTEDVDADDPLAAWVRDAVGKAVQGATRRRPSAEG